MRGTMETKVVRHQDLIVVEVHDVISIQNIQAIEKVWERQLNEDIRMLAIDFTRVDRIDSIGLSHLVKLSRKAIIKEIDLVFFGLNRPIHDLFKIARLDTFFNILGEAEFEEKFLPRR
jgi:anti-anti-sigma factor